jgi:hypothetical protein
MPFLGVGLDPSSTCEELSGPGVHLTVSLLRNFARRYKLAEPELKNRLFRRRCANCGFLGALEDPDSSRALPDVGEVTEEHRQRWRHRLITAREMGKLHGSEYDHRMGQDIGFDPETTFGVVCSLGRPEGPSYAQFRVPGRRESLDEFTARASQSDYIIRVKDPSYPSPFGRPIAMVTTFVWQLVQPHSCPAFMKYRAGLTPAGHQSRREWLYRWKLGAAVTVGVAVLGAFVTLLTWWLGR